MRDGLGFCIYNTTKYGMDGQWLHFPGERILQLIQNEANRLAAQRSYWPKGALEGNSGSPKRLRSIDDWIRTWRTIRAFSYIRSTDSYFDIAGRKIQRIAGGWIKGGFADGYYVRDTAYSGRVNEAVWAKGDGASYVDFATFFFKHGGHQVEQSDAIGAVLRSVLTGTPDCSRALPASVNSALPLLAAAMFIAEPARNPRAHIIGLMMLDMVGRVYNSNNAELKFYTVTKLFAHPDRLRSRAADWNMSTAALGAAKTAPQKGPTVVGSDRNRQVTQAFAPAATDVVYVEGKYSPSPSLSGRTGQTVDLAHDYIQKKELTLATRWLALQLNRNHGNLADLIFQARKAGTADGSIDVTATARLDPEVTDAKNRAWTEITRLITQRATTFPKM